MRGIQGQLGFARSDHAVRNGESVQELGHVDLSCARDRQENRDHLRPKHQLFARHRASPDLPAFGEAAAMLARMARVINPAQRRCPSLRRSEPS
jgi:hypothetical protein